MDGIKGVPVLALHPHFDLIYGMVIDSMHRVVIGVVKALLVHWFSASKKQQKYSAYEKVNKKALTASSNSTLFNRLVFAMST